MAFKKSLEFGERIPIGLFYKADRPVFEQQMPALSQDHWLSKSWTRRSLSVLEEYT
jgi:hypothetical protein